MTFGETETPRYGQRFSRRSAVCPVVSGEAQLALRVFFPRALHTLAQAVPAKSPHSTSRGEKTGFSVLKGSAPPPSQGVASLHRATPAAPTVSWDAGRSRHPQQPGADARSSRLCRAWVRARCGSTADPGAAARPGPLRAEPGYASAATRWQQTLCDGAAGKARGWGAGRRRPLAGRPSRAPSRWDLAPWPRPPPPAARAQAP